MVSEVIARNELLPLEDDNLWSAKFSANDKAELSVESGLTLVALMTNNSDYFPSSDDVMKILAQRRLISSLFSESQLLFIGDEDYKGRLESTAKIESWAAQRGHNDVEIAAVGLAQRIRQIRQSDCGAQLVMLNRYILDDPSDMYVGFHRKYFPDKVAHLNQLVMSETITGELLPKVVITDKNQQVGLAPDNYPQFRVYIETGKL